MKLKDISDYVRPKETVQDKISNNPEELTKKMEGYIQIYPENYKDIECGIWIKYLTEDNKYRSGGILKINKAPEYFVIKNSFNNVSWTVSLEKNKIFIKGTSNKLEKMVIKNNLYKLYTAGLITISDNDAAEALLEDGE
tara:strand:+ start:215 stop:631 length:417 start_codon:yes stop_codon:yes gene_type:complete